MTFDNSIVVIAVFILVIVGLIKFQNDSHRVFGVGFIALVLTGQVTTQQIISSFSNVGLLTLILLMVCSLALEKTSLLRKLARQIITPNYNLTWLRLYLLTSITSAFLNNTAVVATLLSPIRNNSHHNASKLLIPLSYAAIFGGTLTLIGTSTNLIVNSMAIESGFPSLGFFDFTAIGIGVFIACGIALRVMSQFLPDVEHKTVQAADYFIDLEVNANSKLIGKSIEENGLRNLENVFLVEIYRDNRLISPVSPSQTIEAHDRLLFSGDISQIQRLLELDGLFSFAGENGLPVSNLTEVLIRPESVLVGKTLKRSGFRALFDAAVVGIKRDGEKVSGKLGNVVLKAGDYLILATGEDFKYRKNISKNFYVISSNVETEQVLTGSKETIAIWGFVLTIGLSACGLTSLFNGLIVLLTALIFSGCLTSNEIMHRLPRNIWIIIGSALVISNALQNAGVLEQFKGWLVSQSGYLTPILGLIVVYVITWLMTELMTNNAAAALVFPLAYSLSLSLGVNPEPYVLAVAFGASASFISPYGYQTNLMVYSAGNYRLQDFVKIGLPISVIYGTVVVAMLGYLYL
ncbi:SLC13 family permease [Vibrio viridaestus]|uniref:SLC13 family permease n=2 Tax=Vibrio viridaestus TaxID=2487322 RepID=A0A3N9TD57_9VIBR|nr:SLC13 family permease [Vibrio viridaestus]